MANHSSCLGGKVSIITLEALSFATFNEFSFATFFEHIYFCSWKQKSTERKLFFVAGE